MREFSIGKRLIEGYLHQPYSWFKSSQLCLGKVYYQVSTIVSGGLSPLMELIAKGLVTITLIILLVIADQNSLL